MLSFQFNMSTDGGSNYNVTKTTTFFRAYHDEAGYWYMLLSYEGTEDLAQSTSFATITSKMEVVQMNLLLVL
jgi:hypothetical protein